MSKKTQVNFTPDKSNSMLEILKEQCGAGG